MQNDPSGPQSTMGLCNYTTYGSWANFPALLALVQNHASPTMAQQPTGTGSATITGPGMWSPGQPATVTWTSNQRGAQCASGVRVVMNKTLQTGNPVLLSAGQVTIPKVTYPPNTQVTLELKGMCTGAIVSNAYTTTIPAPIPTLGTIQRLRQAPGPESAASIRAAVFWIVLEKRLAPNAGFTF